jgi:hypothetical protein
VTLAYCREIVDLSTVSLGMKILVSEVHLARLDGGSKPSVEVFWQGKGKGCSNERIDVNVKEKKSTREDRRRTMVG